MSNTNPKASQVVFEGGQTVEDLTSTTDPTKGADLVGYVRDGAGWVGSSVQDRIKQFAYSVKEAGATGDGVTDDSAAIRTAVLFGLSARKAVYLPAGTYRMATQEVFTGSNQIVTLFGDGIGKTKILVDNISGGLAFNAPDRASQILVRDIEFIANQAGSGTGLSITMPEGGDRHNRSATLDGVKFSVTNENDAVTYKYFNSNLDLSGCWRPYLNNVVVSGPWGPGISSDWADTSPQFKATYGVNFGTSYHPEVNNCYIWGCQYGIHSLSALDPGPEGIRIIGTNIVGVKRAVNFERPAREQTFWIENCHLNFRDYGLYIKGCKEVKISGTVSFNEDTLSIFASPVDFRLDNVEDVIVTNNIFHYPGNPNRVNIEVVSTTFADNILISQNTFDSVGSACVVIGAAATGVVAFNNFITNAYTNFYIDNSGAARIIQMTSDSLQLSMQNDDATTHPKFKLVKSSTSPAAADRIAALVFAGKNSADATFDYATIRATSTDVTNGTEDGELELFVANAGAAVKAISLDNGTATSNNTAMWLLTNNAGSVSLRRVTVGASDSGGVGFRVLRVAN